MRLILLHHMHLVIFPLRHSNTLYSTGTFGVVLEFLLPFGRNKFPFPIMEDRIRLVTAANAFFPSAVRDALRQGNSELGKQHRERALLFDQNKRPLHLSLDNPLPKGQQI